MRKVTSPGNRTTPPPCTSSHPSFKTEQFFICTCVTSERNVTSVQDSRFLRKREKRVRRQGEIVFHEGNVHEADRFMRNASAYEKEMIGRQKIDENLYIF